MEVLARPCCVYTKPAKINGPPQRGPGQVPSLDLEGGDVASKTGVQMEQAFWGLLPGEPVSRCCPLVLSTSTTPVYRAVSTSIRELLGGCQTLVVPQKDRRTSLPK